MPGVTYAKLTVLVQQTIEELRSKMEEPGGELYRKLFMEDLESLQELVAALQKYRSVFFKTLGLSEDAEYDKSRPGEYDNDEVEGTEPTDQTLDGEYEDDIPGRVVGEFTRLPKGGTIYNPAGDDVFVPEVWVRNLQIEHRDIVSAVPLDIIHGSQLYEFAVIEKVGLGHTSQRESTMGPVYHHNGEWFVYSEKEGTAITLNPKDVKTLNLREGDQVEVAYPCGELHSARVAWKFDDSPFREKTRETVHRQERREKPALEIGDPILSGRVVLVVGGDLYRDAFHRNFTRRGAEFLWESGFQGGTGKSIESKVRSSDIVVIVTEMMSHRIPDIEAICKRHNKPYVYAPSKGSTGAVRECQKTLAGRQRGYGEN
ncbi:MAG: DUF2325 domain-containing protein [Peptococcaceae bacterium]|jgi:hypothetical protein|nr:DUF2325 domain-containing protein [Peptococcaceae bacterium]